MDYQEQLIRLEQLAILRKNIACEWGTNSPNDESRRLCSILLSYDRLPDRIVIDTMGGLCAYYFSNKKLDGGASVRYGDIAFSNDGEICYITADRINEEFKGFDVATTPEAIREAYEGILEYLKNY